MLEQKNMKIICMYCQAN